MKREDLTELHYITHTDNIGSILRRGILSHRLAKKHPHESIASAEVQERRSKAKVANGKPLHEYANLYFHARNPMMYTRVMNTDINTLCVLRIDPNIIDQEGVVITDKNATKDFPHFVEAPEGLRIVDHELTFAQSWVHPDIFEMHRRKGAKCAEVLVPNSVPPRFIMGIYVPNSTVLDKLKPIFGNTSISVNSDIFFR